MGEQISGDSQLRQLLVAVFPPEYVGPVYVTLGSYSVPAKANIQLLWGPWKYERAVAIKDMEIGLVFAKTQSGEGQPPLRVVTSEPLIIGVHTGHPDGVAVDCNEGWTRQ